MKYHKIRNVPLSVCTAEQKVAYNLAWAWGRTLADGGCFSTWPEIARKLCELYTMGYDYTPGKYDIDAIFCALNAGLENYYHAKYHILGSYEEIGRMFPANYLKSA